MEKDYSAKIPRILAFETTGTPESGFLVSTQQARLLPFPVKRVFWIRQVPAGVRRGLHAGKTMAEVLVAVQGQVAVQTVCRAGRQQFLLDQPDQGLFVPEKCWIELSFSPDALLLCLASTDYDPQDYITDYDGFRKLYLSDNIT